MAETKYGLLTYQANPEYNVGDYIQSLAAAQFLPRIDKYMNREKLNNYRGEPIKLIMNGWFMHRPANWPPSDQIDPLLISFHLNSQAKEQLLDKEGREWFKRHEPVGCRDIYTLRAMSDAGIEAYLSGCLTTTFLNQCNYRTDEIYFTDVLFRVPGWSTVTRTPKEFLKSVVQGDFLKIGQRKRLLGKLFTDQLLDKAISISHYHSARHTEKERFGLTEDFLKKYATAKLVVTSRLHCALPCLAFGTPVIFVHFGFKNAYDTCRLNGVTDLFNTIYIDEDENVTTNFQPPSGRITENISLINPDTFNKHVKGLRNNCQAFINEVPFTV